jgi:pimeloyl-ACP methyl ester carboxylesterase
MGHVVFLGGNGHCAARLDGARAALKGLRSPLTLVDVDYPGFEGRSRATHPDAFLDAVHSSMAAAVPPERRVLLYGTGVGGLLLLCLRARGEWMDTPLLLQAPILWGLERRRLPAVMRVAPVRSLLHTLFAVPLFQRWFVGRYFTRPLDPAERASFFSGYARCSALPDLFAWLGPPLLRRLETAFQGAPERVARVSVWWGGRDRVVGQGELRTTEAALGVRWPVTIFPKWGHYPMIDAPEEWVDALAAIVDRL